MEANGGAKGNKSDGDQALRACFAEPVENELSEFIGRLAEAKKGVTGAEFLVISVRLS